MTFVCEECICFPVCQNQVYADILLDCLMLMEYVESKDDETMDQFFETMYDIDYEDTIKTICKKIKEY